MDWGLITLDSKRFPYTNKYVAMGFPAASTPCVATHLAAPISLPLGQPASLQKGETIYMTGRTTGLKSGQINGIDIDCRISYPVIGRNADGEDIKEMSVIVSTEKAFITKTPAIGKTPFSEPGDSGGPVWNEAGKGRLGCSLVLIARWNDLDHHHRLQSREEDCLH